MEFTLTPLSVVNVSADKLDPEVCAAVDEMWTAVKEHPGHAVKFSFPTATERETWFKTAVTYGKTIGVNIRKVKGSDSMNTEHGNIALVFESTHERHARALEIANRAEKVMILKAHGHEPVRGRKTPDQVKAEDEILQRHYELTPEKQREILANFING